jgi:hypothetical protein
VKRKDVAEAVEEFIAVRKPLTEAKAGKRAQLSKNYVYSVGLWLRDFAKTFPNNAVCDLGKEHLNLFMRKHATHSPKSRNHYKGLATKAEAENGSMSCRRTLRKMSFR